MVDPELQLNSNGFAITIEVRRPVELREATSLGVAATLGWRRPLVLLPAAWRKWTQ